MTVAIGQYLIRSCRVNPELLQLVKKNSVAKQTAANIPLPSLFFVFIFSSSLPLILFL